MIKHDEIGLLQDNNLTTKINKIITHRPTRTLLHKIASQWAFVYDAIRDGVLITDKKYKIILCNKAFRKIFRKDFNRIKGKYCWQVIYGDKKCKQNCPFTRAKKSKHRESKEIQITNKYYHVTVDPIFDLNKKFIGAIHILTNVTERKKVVQILSEGMEKYRGLVKNMSLGVYRSTADGKILDANPAMFKMLGFRSKKQFVKHTATEFYQDPQDRKRLLRKLKKYGSITAHEVLLKKRNGTPLIVSVFARAYQVKPGKINWIDGIIEDITEKKRIENKMINSENKFRRIVENSNDVIVLTNSDRIIEYVSPSATKVLGYTAKELIGKAPKIWHKDDTSIVEKITSLARRGKSGETYEYRIITKKGEIKWVNHTWAPIKEGKKLQRIVNIISDITERKLKEQEEQKKLAQIIRYQSALLKIAKIRTPDYKTAIKKIIEIDAKLLNVERVSFWLASNDLTEIHCQDQYLKSKNIHEKGLILYAKNYPYYFQALQQGRIIAVSDVYNNIRTFEFADDYFRPNKIISMMDVPIWISGKLIGILCHEHTKTIREWTADEQSFATSVADTISVILESHQHKIAQNALKENEEKYRGLVENINIGILRTAPDGRILEANPACARIFGYTSDEIKRIKVPELYYDPKIRPQIIEKVSQCGFVKNLELTFKKKDNTLFFGLLSVQAHQNKDGKVDWFDSAIEDITERKQIESIKQRREAILDAITYASECFLAKSNWESLIQNILARLGKAAEVSRVYIFQKHLSPDNQILISQRYEWVSNDISPQIDNPEMQNFNALAYDCRLIDDLISKGKPIVGNTRDFPEAEKRVFSAQDILSIVLAPIYVQKKIWGLIGFDECRTERNWSPIEIDTLKVAANIIGSAIQRQYIELTLRENEYKYRSLVNMSPFGIAIVDSDGKILFVNPKAMHILGAKTSSQLVGQSAMKFVHPDFHQIVAGNISQILKTGKAIPTEEEKYIRLDGSVVDVEVSAKPFVYNNKPAIIVIANDISERKQIETMIAESEEKYRSLIQNINVGVYRATPDGRFIEVNPAFARIFGYKSTQDVMKIFATDLYQNPQDRESLLKKMQQNGYVKNYEIKQKKKDGTPIIISLTSQPHKDENGKIVWYDGVVEDITERKQTEQTLKQSEERYRTLFETANDGICVLSTDGIVLSANRKLLELSGFSEKDIGYHISKYGIFTPEHLAIIQQNMKARIAGEKIKPYEVVIYPKKGIPKTVEITASLLYDTNNKVTAEVVFLHDITDRKQVEIELQKSKESAETANKAKTSFLHNMSHELRSPMTSIIGFTNLLLDSPQSPENKEMLEAIKTSSNYLLKIINDLLDLSKIEAGKITVENNETNIIETVKKIHLRYQPIAQNKNINFKLAIDESLPEYIITDRTKIEQIISNLLDNSFKFTERGTIELYVGIKTDVKQSSPLLHFYIKDTGIGIKPDQIQRIFEKFEQSEFYISKRYSGAGLGLTIIKQLTDLLKGTISVSSQLTKGTKFTILIPVEFIKKNKQK